MPSCHPAVSLCFFTGNLQQSLLAFATTKQTLTGASMRLRPTENKSDWSLARWMCRTSVPEDATCPHSTHLCALMAVLATSRPLPFTCPRWGAGAGLGRTPLRASQTPYRCSLRRGRAVRAQVWCGAPAAGECAAVSRGGDTHCDDSWRDGSLSAHGKMWRLLDVDTPLMMLLLLLCVYFPLGPGWRRPASLLLTCSVKKKNTLVMLS